MNDCIVCKKAKATTCLSCASKYSGCDAYHIAKSVIGEYYKELPIPELHEIFDDLIWDMDVAFCGEGIARTKRGGPHKYSEWRSKEFKYKSEMMALWLKLQQTSGKEWTDHEEKCLRDILKYREFATPVKCKMSPEMQHMIDKFAELSNKYDEEINKIEMSQLKAQITEYIKTNGNVSTMSNINAPTLSIMQALKELAKEGVIIIKKGESDG